MLFPVAHRRRPGVRSVAFLSGLAAWAAVPLPCSAGDVAATARDVLARHADAIVRVTATLKQDMAGFGIQFGGGGGERMAEAIGTVIDPTGIVVVASAALNPTGAMMAEGIEFNVAGERKKIEMKTEMSKPVIHLAEGTEVPARIALEDPDSGLTFIVPEKHDGKAFACMTAEAAVDVRPLDEVILVSRLGKQYGSAPAAAIARIKAVVTKPRRGAVPEGFEHGSAFDQNGRFLGVTTIRMPSIRDTSGGMEMPMPLIIPAADLAELAAQVREQAATSTP